MNHPKTIISPENAIELILRGEEIANFHFTGTTDL